MRHAVTLLLLALVGALAGCPSPRTTAATRPTPAAFKPADSDPAAVALVDASLQALGAGDKWDKIKELRFGVLYKVNGTLAARYEHAWDRWNGRHALRTADMRSVAEVNREDDIRWHDVRYDIINKDAVFWASYANQEAARADYAKAADLARIRLAEDGYRLSLIYKLHDPGVRLSVAGALAPSVGVCDPSCDSVKITFDPEVGTDTWYVHINKNTAMPEIIEQETARGRLGYKLGNWVESGGLKWPTLMTNVGLAGETFEFTNIKVGDPLDRDYGRAL
jgi:hypothetical protein